MSFSGSLPVVLTELGSADSNYSWSVLHNVVLPCFISIEGS